MTFNKMLQQIISENNFNFEPQNIQKDDLPTRQNKRRIEDLIRGTIHYYRNFENIQPQEQGQVDELVKFSNYLTRQLNSYRNFK